MRVPVDLSWLAGWADPAVVNEFSERTRTFFRTEGSVWQFVHNSFRRFLSDRTAEVAGSFNQIVDRELHARLADACQAADGEWSHYRDEELVHRLHSGQLERVLKLGDPTRLRNDLIGLRPVGVIRDHAVVALRAATARDEPHAALRSLLFLSELGDREVVFDAEKTATALVDVGASGALEHVLGGGELRVDTNVALDTAAKLSRNGELQGAARVLTAAGGLAGAVEQARHWRSGDLGDLVGSWAEVVCRLSGYRQVVAELDHVLPPPDESEDRRENESAQEVYERDDRSSAIRAARNIAHARCFDILTRIGDENGLRELSAVIDAEAPTGWRARACLVRAFAAYDVRDLPGNPRLDCLHHRA